MDIKKHELENLIFDTQAELHKNLSAWQKSEYFLTLKVLEDMNLDYFIMTGRYFVDLERIKWYNEKLKEMIEDVHFRKDLRKIPAKNTKTK